MFDDLHGIDDVVRGLWLAAFGLLIVNPVLVFFGTRWAQRIARRHGRRGHWLSSLAIVLAIDVVVIIVLVKIFTDA